MIITTVGQAISSRALVKVAPQTSIRAACEMMASENVGALPVLDGLRLVGLVSERDVVRRAVLRDLPMRDTPVAQIMTEDPTTVWKETSLVLAMDLMTRGGFRHLPVTDDETCVGMLSIRDIPSQYRVLYERYEAALSELDDVVPD